MVMSTDRVLPRTNPPTNQVEGLRPRYLQTEGTSTNPISERLFPAYQILGNRQTLVSPSLEEAV